MQISSVQSVSPQFTTDRADTSSMSETIQDRTRQDRTRALATATKIVNESGQIGSDRELTIALDRNSGQAVIRLIDRQTREVVQQIPEERVLRMAEEFKRATAKTAAPGGSDWLSMLG
jgi:uncharacterized FlaG/YvyC family protein